MNENSKETWNTVCINNIYSENGGYKLNRRNLVNSLCNHSGDSLLVFSASGVASVLVFRKRCHFQLYAANDLDKLNIRVIASQINEETVKTEKTIYKVNFDSS